MKLNIIKEEIIMFQKAKIITHKVLEAREVLRR